MITDGFSPRRASATRSSIRLGMGFATLSAHAAHGDLGQPPSQGSAMTSTDVLFKPFHLKSLSLPNRIVMAPMTRSKSPSQIPNDSVVAYYKTRAVGGTGLI